MSRWGDDPREDSNARPEQQSRERQDPDRDRHEDLPVDHLSLPRSEEREPVEFRGREYSLNRSDVAALHTVGAFRVICPGSFDDGLRDGETHHGSWRHLEEQGLLSHDSISDRDGQRDVLALTRTGKDLLDAHSLRYPSGNQVYYADIVKPRELAHDVRIYDAFRVEADRLEREGARITRVLLDYELKSKYQAFLHRDSRASDATPTSDRRDFAESHELPLHRGHVVFPDVRIEYEVDGRREHLDVEVVTEHYSRGQLSGKAGFSCHGRSGSSRGGTPFDPRHTRGSR